MRLGGEGPSSNFEDRTGQSGGGFGGGGGNLLGCLLPLVMSRFGLIGVAILLLGYCALQSLGGGGMISGGGPTTSAPSGQSTLEPNMADFLKRVLGSTEETWGEIFAKSGSKYQPTGWSLTPTTTNPAAARRKRRWARSIARPTRRFTSTRLSSTNCRSASALPAISRWPM